MSTQTTVYTCSTLCYFHHVGRHQLESFLCCSAPRFYQLFYTRFCKLPRFYFYFSTTPLFYYTIFIPCHFFIHIYFLNCTFYYISICFPCCSRSSVLPLFVLLSLDTSFPNHTTHAHIVRKSPETIEYNTYESHTVDLVDWVYIPLY